MDTEVLHMTERLKNELLKKYKDKNHVGLGFMFPFGLPFTIGCFAFAGGSFLGFAEGEILGGLLLLLLGAPFFGLIAWFLGWYWLVDYLRTIRKIKRDTYTKASVECTSKSVRKSAKYDSDGPTTWEDFANICFRGENEEYTIKEWGTFSGIDSGRQYLLIFFGKTDRIDAILDQWSQTVVYLR